MAKATNAQIARRVREVYSLLLNGSDRGHIFRYASEKWDVTERMVEHYIARATEQIKASAAVEQDYELGKALARLDDLYARAMTAGDRKAALAVQKERSETLGLKAPVKIKDVTDMPDEELIRRAEEAARRIDTLCGGAGAAGGAAA